jgi:uncharacterized protein (UPF0332 family)
MISTSIQRLLALAKESHETAQTILDAGSARFSVAQSYYTMFYLVEALLLSKGLTFSSHSAVVAAYGKEFARTKLLDPSFHRRIIVTQKRREVGHYGDENEEVTEEEARESFQWADEFMQAVKGYFGV